MKHAYVICILKKPIAVFEDLDDAEEFGRLLADRLSDIAKDKYLEREDVLGVKFIPFFKAPRGYEKLDESGKHAAFIPDSLERQAAQDFAKHAGKTYIGVISGDKARELIDFLVGNSEDLNSEGTEDGRD